MAVLRVTPANEHYIVVLIELCISKHLVEVGGVVVQSYAPCVGQQKQE